MNLKEIAKAKREEDGTTGPWNGEDWYELEQKIEESLKKGEKMKEEARERKRQLRQ